MLKSILQGQFCWRQMLDLIVNTATQQYTSFIIFKEIFVFTSNLAVTLISMYTACLRFFSKNLVALGVSSSHDRFYGDTASVIIENRTFSSFTINKIYVVYNNEYKLLLKKFEEPFVIEPFKACKFTSKGITQSSPIDIQELSHLMTLADSYYIVETSRGNIYCTGKKQSSKKINKKAELTLISCHYNSFNGKVLNINASYVLSILCESGSYKDIVIDKYGLMSEDLLGFNQLSNEAMKDFKSCCDYFKKLGTEQGLTFNLYDIALNGSNQYYRFKYNKQNSQE